MGIDATLAYLIASTTRRFAARGSICTLGVQDVHATESELAGALAAAGLSRTPSRRPFFERLGFDVVESLDVSDFEGCTHLLDLNEPGVPQRLRGRYDAIYNGGTLEHVFDVRNALRNIHDLLRPDGIVIHIVPACGWLDHGFYQISPTLLTDYYAANGFELLEATLLDIVAPGHYEATAYMPGAPPPPRRPAPQTLFYATVRKQPGSTWHVVPQQRYYATIHGAPQPSSSPLRVHPPFAIRNGIPDIVGPARYPVPSPSRGKGFEWTALLPSLRHLADARGRTTSPLILFEDGEPIGPAHALHADVRTLGRGRYSHWEGALHFSTSRNDDPRDHTYSYALLDPAPVAGDGDRHMHMEPAL